LMASLDEALGFANSNSTNGMTVQKFIHGFTSYAIQVD